jgi:hypothetical protein
MADVHRPSNAALAPHPSYAIVTVLHQTTWINGGDLGRISFDGSLFIFYINKTRGVNNSAQVLLVLGNLRASVTYKATHLATRLWITFFKSSDFGGYHFALLPWIPTGI